MTPEQEQTARHLARHIELAPPEDDGNPAVRFLSAPCPECKAEPAVYNDLVCIVMAARAFAAAWQTGPGAEREPDPVDGRGASKPEGSAAPALLELR